MKKIKVNADIYVNDKKLAKDDDVVNIQKLLSGSSESEKTVQLSSINDFYDVKDGTDIKITSQYPIELFFHKKNLLPFEILTYDQNLTTVDESDESLTVTITAGSTFKHFRLKPILLKKGIYTISRKVQIVSGDSLSNAGTVYIYAGDSESEQTKNIKTFNANSTQLELVEDQWVKLDVYANTNGTLTHDTTIKFYSFQIENGDSYTSYEKYDGKRETGLEFTISPIAGLGVYSASTFTAKYTSSTTHSLDYETIKKKVVGYETEIGNIKDKIANIGSSTSKTVVAWGDSLTNGTGSDIAKPASETNSDTSYPAVLGRKLGSDYTVINAGVGGEPTWMIAARQGGLPVQVLPTTIPATKTAVRIYLQGPEQNAYYNADSKEWTYMENALSYNIAVDGNARINPVKINGIEGTLTRSLLSAGDADPTTGETVQSNSYAYYFTRSEAGAASTFNVPKTLITNASEEYKDAITIIWTGQNDSPKINNKYAAQIGSEKRIRRMIEHTNSKKYIIMQVPSSSDVKDTKNDQIFTQEFGEHYINIRKFICEYGIDLANSMGYTITRDTNNTFYNDNTVDTTYATVGDSIDAGVIPRVFRKDGVHGNYYYYQMVALAVYEKGKDLGYW